MFEHQATSEVELSIKPGDIVSVVNTDDDGILRVL